jgi:predicted RecB family endonuclease
MQWTAADELRLVELYTAGATFRDMATELRRSVASLRSRVHRLRRAGVVAGRYAPRSAEQPKRRPSLDLEQRARQFSGRARWEYEQAELL